MVAPDRLSQAKAALFQVQSQFTSRAPAVRAAQAAQTAQSAKDVGLTAPDVSYISDNFLDNVQTSVHNGMPDELAYSYAGIAADAQMAKYNNEWSALQAKISRDFEREMSNTAYQRAVKDLKAAGLNPILAASGGGASTPNSSQATVDTGATGTASQLSSSMLNAATQLKAVKANNEVALKTAQIQADAQKAAAATSAYYAYMAAKYQTDHAGNGTLYGTIGNAILGMFGGDGSNNWLKIGKGLRNFITNTIKNISKGKYRGVDDSAITKILSGAKNGPDLQKRLSDRLGWTQDDWEKFLHDY